MAFAALGCHVEVLCARGHPATHVGAVERIHLASALRPAATLRAAIAMARPDLVIPCDDGAAVQLAELHRHSRGLEAAGAALDALLRSSLGDPQACLLATARGLLLQLASAQGIRIPHTEVIPDAAALSAALSKRTLPAVLKIDSTWGGLGVAIVHERAQAQRGFARMSMHPPLAGALARLLLDRDLAPLLDAMKRGRRTVTLQDFIVGTPANRAVACRQGRVLAGTSVVAVHTQDRTGPATVVRVIDNPEMTEAARRLVARLGLSGLWGIDFVLAASTGAAYMIEMNPRATPICHLPLGPGHDLPAALVSSWTGGAPVARLRAIPGRTVAIFPGEWERDPASPHLRDDWHDIPWDEPDLVRDGIGLPWHERGLVARAWAALRPRRVAAPAPAPAQAIEPGEPARHT